MIQEKSNERYQLLIAETKKIVVYVFSDRNDFLSERAPVLADRMVRELNIIDSDKLRFESILSSKESAYRAFRDGALKYYEGRKELKPGYKGKGKLFCMLPLSSDEVFRNEVMELFKRLS